MSYGLWKFGGGTGNYAPSKNSKETETSITNKSIKAIKEHYPEAFVLKVHGGTYQRSGIPDLYIAINKHSIWIEMKRPGADTTALQKNKLEQLKKVGVYCGTADSPQTVLEIIKDALA